MTKQTELLEKIKKMVDYGIENELVVSMPIDIYNMLHKELGENFLKK